jgi:alkylation response protein AidB-like acyl-CoA dehydrogenase
VTVELEGVLVPHDRVLGEPGAGLELALAALDLGRLGTAAQAVGIGRAALEHAVAYAREREQFGQPIAHFGGIQEKLAEMARRVTVARAATHAAAARVGTVETGGHGAGGLDGSAAWAAVAKLTASEAAMWVTDEAVQVFGGYGYMRDYPVEKLMRDAKGTEIYEGTSEILRVVIARALLRAAD